MAFTLQNTFNPSSARRLTSALACALLGLLYCTASWAKLDGDLASVQADQQAWGASTNQTTLASGATLFTQTLPEGVTVRQYVGTDGRVVAVGWDGPTLPDFARLLGTHFSIYLDAVRQQKRGVSVQGATLVIESGGRMGSFAGRAYLPGQLPARLSAQDIR